MPKTVSETTSNILENGNAIDKGRTIPDNSLDIIFCDPPSFNCQNDRQLNNWNTQTDYEKWFRLFINISSLKLKKTGIFYLIGDANELARLFPIIEDFGFSNCASYYFVKNKKLHAGRRSRDINRTVKIVDSVFVFCRDIQKKVKKLLKLKQQEYQKSARDVNYQLSGNSNGGGYWSIYCGENSRNILPSESHWSILCEMFEIEIPYSEIQPQFVEWDGFNFWDDLNYQDDKFLSGTNRPNTLYERLLMMNRKSKSDITCWDPFSGYANCVNVMEKYGCKYYATELDMKIFYKALLNTGRTPSFRTEGNATL